MKIRINFAHRSSHTQLRQLADFRSLIIRSSFAHRSLIVRSCCILSVLYYREKIFLISKLCLYLWFEKQIIV
ncbi:MAG: hypothetical protein HG435_008450 [Capnocytophaga sp.]|nr:hypothetical protein [Capnocytophaga sp.]MBB1569512.1 hypothetical protein [Capnocytophaga sp.]